jgi:Tfp pilus assembly protein PilO
VRGRGRLIGAIAIGVVVCALFYLFALGPKRSTLSQVRTDIEAEEARTVQLQAELTRLQGLQENAPELEAELAQIRGFVPDSPQVPNFIFQVEDASKSAGVSFLNITPELPKTPPEGAALAEVRITIDAKGGYFSIQDFLRRLYRLDRALRVDTLSMTGAAAPDGSVDIALNMVTRIFYELPAPAVAAAPAPAGTPVPVASPTVVP